MPIFYVEADHTQSLLLLSPSQNESVTTKNFTLSWSNVGAERYELYVDNNSGLGSPEISMNNTGTSYTLDGIWLSQNVYYWKVFAFFSDGSQQESDSGSFTYTPPLSPAPVWVPLYRLYNNSIDDHFYTTVKAHKEGAESAEEEENRYKYEKIECYLSDRPYDSPDSKPLYHLYSADKNEHYYTSDANEKDILINTANGDYQYQGIVGFLNATTSDGLLPLEYARHSANTDNFYTVSKLEYDNAVNSYAFSPMGIVGYVSPSGLLEPEAHTRPQANFGGIDLGSGAYRGLNNLDLSMKGRGPSLSFAHYYNSFNFNQYPMGYGWNHNLNNSIIENIETGDVLVIWGNGTASEFLKNGTSYTDNSGNHDKLVLVDDGYNLTRKNQTILRFRKIGGEYSYKIVLLTVEDWKENILTYDYEAVDAFLLSVRDDMGRKIVLDYNTSDELIKVKEQVNGTVKRSVSFTYNTDGLLETFTDALGKVTRYTYYAQEDARQYLLKSIIYPEQNDVEIDYYDSRQVSSVKTGDDPASSITYEPSSNTATVIDPAGNSFRYIHDDFRLTSPPDYKLDAFKYEDPLNPNQPTYIEDKVGNKTYFEYDDMGNMVKTTNDRGKIAEFSYNDKNNITSKTDFHAAGSVIPDTEYNYDTNNNRLVSVSNPENETTWVFYDANQQVDQIKNGRNYSSYFEYDTYGNLAESKDAEGNITSFTNDYAGRTTHVSDAENKNTGYVFDNNDHLKTITNHLNHQVGMSYNDNGFLETVSWLNESERSTTSYSYDDEDRLASIENPANDKARFTYNISASKRTRQDYLGNTTTYNYDLKNRLDSIVYPDHTVSIGRNSNGKITSATCPEGSTSIEYNSLNQVKKYTDPYGKTVQYSYNDAGRLETLTYPDGKTVRYGYDDAGRLETVRDWLSGTTTYYYDNAGNLDNIVRPNSTEAVYVYDKASRLTAITEQKSNGTVIASYAYELDGVGNHKSVSATEPLVSTPFSEETTYITDKKTNRLLSAGSLSFTYDDNGNRKTSSASGGTTYSWNYENRLKSVSSASPSATTQHIYDAFQNRISRVEGSDTKRYVLDITGGMSQVLAETNGSGVITAWYVYGLGLLSRIDASGNRHFYHYNNRGDTVALTDASGEITDSYAYDEYGKVANSTGTTENPFTFVGQFGVMDDGNDSYFMRARFYDSEVGRFLSEDSIGFAGGDLNLYGYVDGNPVMGIDPDGLMSRRMEMGLAFGSAGALVGSFGTPVGSLVGGFGGFIFGYSVGIAFDKLEKSINNYEEITNKLIQCAGDISCPGDIDSMVRERQKSFIDVLKKSQKLAKKMNKSIPDYLIGAGLSDLSGGMKLLIDSGIISIDTEGIITEISNGKIPKSLLGIDVDIFNKK